MERTKLGVGCSAIEKHLNDLAKRADEAYHKAVAEDSPLMHHKSMRLRYEIDGACNLAKILGFTADYNPIDNTFTVTVKEG